MTVYFVAPIENETLVKVGMTDDLDRRLSTLGSQVEGGIRLLAQCNGGKDVENFILGVVADDWVEGEWFKRSLTLERMIASYENGVVGRRVWGRLRAVEGQKSAADVDRELARNLLNQVVGRLPVMPLGTALTKAHSVLQSINPMWSRRRVSALWAREASRVDHYEIRDLETAVALPDEAFHSPQIEGLGGVLGGVDRSGIEG